MIILETQISVPIESDSLITLEAVVQPYHLRGAWTNPQPETDQCTTVTGSAWPKYHTILAELYSTIHLAIH